MDRFPPPDNDRDKLRGNDGTNGNLGKKLSYCTEHLGQKDCLVPHNNQLIGIFFLKTSFSKGVYYHCSLNIGLFRIPYAQLVEPLNEGICVL